MMNTGKTKGTAAKATIACMLASALTLGAATVPALASEAYPADTPIVAQSMWTISEGEAVWAARTHLGIPAEDVYDLEVYGGRYAGRLCYEVEIETWSSDVEWHVMVDAATGDVLGSWGEL